MCGIIGVIKKGKINASESAVKMAQKLSHRGPDDEGYLITHSGDTQIALAHRRLSIIDLSSSGRQPMKFQNQPIWIVYNGEIYNYLELREELASQGFHFDSDTDTEVILAAYLKWGFEAIHKLNGMWAFVIYDQRKKLIWGARDRTGVKPFYFIYEDGEFFAFASEIKAFWEFDAFQPDVNEKILWDYLVFGFVDHDEQTFFKNVRRLPAGHMFLLDLKKLCLKIIPYWQTDYTRQTGVFSREALKRHKADLQAKLESAIRLRLRSDVPVGSCLSGGLDSSSIVLIINNLLRESYIDVVGEKQKVITAVYPGSSVDESFYAEKVVRKTQADWIRVYPNSESFIAEIEKLVYVQDEPFGSSSIYAQFKVMQAASENGLKVMLDGQGGDELFWGYKLYYRFFLLSLAVQLELIDLMREIRHISNSPLGTYRAVIGEMIKGLFSFLLPKKFILKAFQMSKTADLRFIKTDFLRSYAERSEMHFELMRHTNPADFAYKMFTRFSLPQLLRYEDRNSMWFSVEARTPLADDINLINFAFNLPAVYKIHNGWSKFIFREAMRSLLPAEVAFRRDKIGFATPEKEWLKKLKPYIIEIIRDYPNDFIDTDYVIQNFDRLNQSNFFELWKVINTVLWIKMLGELKRGQGL